MTATRILKRLLTLSLSTSLLVGALGVTGCCGGGTTTTMDDKKDDGAMEDKKEGGE